MKESDRIRLLVVDAIDSMGRMSDKILQDSASGISEHLEELLLNVEPERANDIVAASLKVVDAILKPVSEQMLASTSGRYSRSRILVED